MIRDGISPEETQAWEDWQFELAQIAVHLEPGETICFSALARSFRDAYFPDEDLIVIKNRLYNFWRRRLKPEVVVEEPPKEAPEEFKKQPIAENYIATVVERDWQGNRIIRFGLMGDTQIGNKWTQLTHLNDFYDICAREGIREVYHSGDMSDGWDMRVGHVFELYCMGVDETVAEIAKNYPTRPGIKTYFIAGNHDASFVKRTGHYIGNSIQERRSDMGYLGQDRAVVKFTPNCTMELRHPWDGTAYAMSYKIQKMVEAMSGGEKPNILAVGHYHKSMYFPYRNIHCFQTGCFEAQTPFMRGHSLAAMMGGWIVEIHVDSNGFIKRVTPTFYPYYVGIDDDYLNWR